jgi:hypothetical protein
VEVLVTDLHEHGAAVRQQIPAEQQAVA